MVQNSGKKLYAQDGVDVKEEASFSEFAGKICKESYSNSHFIQVHDLSGGNFRGPRPFSFQNLPEGFIVEASSDGIGTKGIVSDAAKMHEFVAYDLIAMTASDITRYGGIPLVLVNILDISSVGKSGDEVNQTYKKAMTGLGKAAKESKIVVLKGETAQMGVAIGSDIKNSKTKINWSGVMIGAYHKDKMITGDKIKEGQVIIALKENGFRSNGISSVRKALKEKFGNEWWNDPGAKQYIKMAAEPSVLYDVFVNTLHGWFSKDFKSEVELASVVHLSGGALNEKLAKDLLLPRGLSATIDDLWDPPEIMSLCAQWRGISDEEFYETWNGGQGMLLIVNKNDAEKVINRAGDFNIKAKIAGKITKSGKPQIIISSKLNKDKKIIFE